MALATSTALIAGMALTAVGTGVSVYSQYQAGKANQRLNNLNAQMSQQAAADRERDGRILANIQRAQNQRLLAKNRALRAKAGVINGTGTPLLVEAQQAMQLEMGAIDVERTSSLEAGKYRQDAVLSRMAGKAARTQGNLGSFATLLQGAGSVGSQYAYGKHYGILN